MAKWEQFSKCPGCGYDISTGEGERGCNYGECPYAPEELNVVCDYCRFNWFTMEGDRKCDRYPECDQGVEARKNVENLRHWLALHQPPLLEPGGDAQPA